MNKIANLYGLPLHKELITILSLSKMNFWHSTFAIRESVDRMSWDLGGLS